MFLFSGAQRRGTIVLVSFMSLFGVYYYLNALILQPDLPPIVVESIKMSNDKRPSFKSKNVKVIELKSKDPNIWGFKEWEQFGFSKSQIKTIVNYKNKLGGFSSYAQLKKCHVISSEKFTELKKFIVFKKRIKSIKPQLSKFNLILIDSIPNYKLNNFFDTLYFQKLNGEYRYFINADFNLNSISNLEDLPNKFQNHGTLMMNRKELTLIKFKKKEFIPFDINQADAIKLSTINGIGKVFSERIIKYRNSLGGFVSLSQFKEIYGLKEDVFSQLSKYVFIDLASINTINLNLVTLDELVQHPYFNWSLANAIVNYRYHHGDFKSKSNLKKIHLVNDEIYRKIAPYISV